MATMQDLTAALDRVTVAVVAVAEEISRLRAGQADPAAIDAAVAKANAAADALAVLAPPAA